MKTLTLPEAEKLKVVMHPGEGWTVWEARARYLVEIRELYNHGFAVCVPESPLWEDFKKQNERFED